MALRSAYAPVLPEMDLFLFAPVGEEVEGIPLSVLSALAQLGLDPRNEAVRLSSLTSRSAASQLGRLLARLPDRPWTSSDIRRMTRKLVELLPAPPNDGRNDQVTNATNGKPSSRTSRHQIYLALALAGALGFGLLTHGYVTADGRETGALPVPQAAPPGLSPPMR